MLTFAETELLLLIALSLSPNSIKTIAEATGIKVNTLYKWKTTDVHLSPSKADPAPLHDDAAAAVEIKKIS